MEVALTSRPDDCENFDPLPTRTDPVEMTDDAVNDADVEAALSRANAFPRRRRMPLYEAPEFVKRLNPFEEVKAGTSVIFECKYKSFPKSTIKWYKDDEEITEDNRYVTEAETTGDLRLVIKDCRKNDEGAYKCKAENSEGVASSTGYLSVTGNVEEKPLSAQPRKVQSDHVISAAPPLRTILEQKSVEEREAEAMALQPPSPLEGFIKDHRSRTWPLAHMGYGASNGEPAPHTEAEGQDEGEESGSDTSVESQGDVDSVSLDLSPDRPQHNMHNGQLEPGAEETVSADQAMGEECKPSTADHVKGFLVDSSSDNDDLGQGGQEDLEDETAPVKVESMIIVNRSKLAELGMSDVYEPGVGKLSIAPDWDTSVVRQRNAPLKRTAALDMTGSAEGTESVLNESNQEPNMATSDSPSPCMNTSPKSATEYIPPATIVDQATKPKAVSLPNFANFVEHLEFPCLYYVAFVSGVTFWASGWQVSPLLVMLLVAIVSLISFHFLSSEESKS